MIFWKSYKNKDWFFFWWSRVVISKLVCNPLNFFFEERDFRSSESEYDSANESSDDELLPLDQIGRSVEDE